ncbi:MAG TPA: hypothetical protein VM261_33475 [Kofleriaceae bacterium]|nr:hypothetical protein [Kofleriaceae bacterium]
MKLALWSGLVAVTLLGCGKKKEEPATATGSGTATAAALDAAAAAPAPDAAVDAAEAAAAAPDAGEAAAPAGTPVLLEGLGPEGSNVEIIAPAGAEGNAYETEDTGLQGRVRFDKVELELNAPPEMDEFEKEKAKLEKEFKVESMEADADGWAAIYGMKKGKDRSLNVLVYRKAVNLVCYAGELKTRADADAVVPVCKSLRAAAVK